MKNTAAKRKVRYGVVGLGYISQIAMLPAFAHAQNSELVAVFSSDPVKLKKLGKKYKVPYTLSYQDYLPFLATSQLDAVYIAVPNSLHRDFVVRAADAGVHVLCEKPLSVTVEDCEVMIQAAKEGGVKLMTAYRLHFDKANLKMIDLIKKKKIGDPQIFNSVFTMQVKKGDIRLQKKLGGGTLYDIGIYCINAARYLFRAEPCEAIAVSAKNGDTRFKEVDQTTSSVLRFPGGRLASFTTSFGASDTASYQVIGSHGDLRMDNIYEYAEPVSGYVNSRGDKQHLTFPLHDQFASELIYFSNCILKNKQPQPSGEEGLADVRIIQALYRSAENGGKPVTLEPQTPAKRPEISQVIERPAVEKQELVHASSPHG